MPLFDFTELFSKQFSRTEFLIHLGVLLVAITGISSLMKTLSDPQLSVTQPKKGYGSSRYGG